jgi:eukaryotic-like serine/threonine-protein kinase
VAPEPKAFDSCTMNVVATVTVPSRVIGRYHLYGEIASGGMATVHYGRMSGPAGFSRTVAVKRLHAQYAKAHEFASMLVDEARIAARVQHPNVVPTVDVVSEDGEMLLVMEYVHGVTLAQLIREVAPARVPLPIAVGIVCGALYGLHAAHEARSEGGELLGVVHRDVSPQNTLVGTDGVSRVADFGIAKAVGRLQTTQDGQLKGKTGYMAPEQIRGRPVDRRTDVYAAAVVLWETVAGRRLFSGDSFRAIYNAVLESPVPKLSVIRDDAGAELDVAVARGLSRDPAERFGTARELAVALEEAVRAASPREIGEWVETSASAMLATRAETVANIEASSVQPRDVSGTTAGPVVVGGGGGDTDPHTTSSHGIGASRKARQWTRVPLVLGAGATALVLGVTAFVTMRGSSAVPRADWPAASSDVAALSDSSSAPEPTTSVPPFYRPSAGKVASGPSATAATRPASRAGPPGTTKPGRLDCNPPYTVDDDGIRRWKKGC